MSPVRRAGAGDERLWRSAVASILAEEDRDGSLASEAEVAAAAEVVHAHGRRMSAHARSAGAVKLCVKHGVKVIYHANYADQEAFDMLEEHKDEVFVSPNIGFTVVASYEGSEWFTEQEVIEFGFRDELAGAIEGVAELRKRGVRILGGGDYGFAFTPHGKNARDLEHLVKYFGFTPIEAIQTMTKFGGQAMDLPEDLGEIREGFLADLLLVDGNPADDVRILVEHDRLKCIMKDGSLHKAPG